MNEDRNFTRIEVHVIEDGEDAACALCNSLYGPADWARMNPIVMCRDHFELAAVLVKGHGGIATLKGELL